MQSRCPKCGSTQIYYPFPTREDPRPLGTCIECHYEDRKRRFELEELRHMAEERQRKRAFNPSRR